jgi:hypothetical protein
VTQQIRDAFYTATHHAIRRNGKIEILDAEEGGTAPAEFMLLQNGGIHFRGTADELMASEDGYVRNFLYMTLPPW